MIKIILFISLLLSSYTQAQKLDKVSLQLQWKHQFEFAGFYMAKEKGFYKNLGLDVELKEYKLGINIIDDVVKGKTTFGTSYSSVVLNKFNGTNIVLLNAILQVSPHIIISLKSSGIKSIKDFKNKRIMIGDNAIRTATFSSMLKSNNISMSDMIRVTPTFNIQDLIDGNTDLITGFSSNELYALDKKGIKYDIWNPEDYGFGLYNVITFTTNNEVNNNPKRVDLFNKATLKGWKYAFDNIEESADVILKKYNTQNRTKEALIYEALVLKKLAYQKGKPLGDINTHNIQRIYDMYNIMGLIKNKIEFSKFIYDSPKNNSFTIKEKNYIKEKEFIKMCNNSILEPIEFANNGNQNDMQGISIDVLKLIGKQLNIKFKNIPTKNWGESQQFLKEKKCDILSVSIITPQRAEYANFTQPYLKLKSAIFTQKNSANFVTFDDVSDKSMSQIKNSGVSHQLQQKYPNLKIIETSSAQEALAYVNNGKAFFSTGFAEVGVHLLRKYALNNVHIAGYTNKIYDITIAVRKDDLTLLSILNKALGNITPEKHSQIYKKWVIPIVKEKVMNYRLLFQFIGGFIIILIIIIYFLIKQKKLNNKIEDLNNNLENKVLEEVEKNRKKDEIMFHQKKLAQMGEMINMIAHQWRQPLSAIGVTTQNLDLHLDINDTVDKKLFKNEISLISEYIKYLSQTIDDFRNFFRDDKDKENILFEDIVNNALKIIGKALKSNNIEVETSFNSNKKINIYKNELSQVVLNLIQNAEDAIVDNNIKNPKIIIEIQESKLGQTLSIKDNAGGIKDDILNKIFEPYFSTKKNKNGTGLGLYMSKIIIEDHCRGSLSVENIEDGVEFKISLEENIYLWN